MHTLEDFYQFLLNHDLVEKVLQYRELYPYEPNTYRCTHNPLVALFAWAATPENVAFWQDLYSKYEMKLAPTKIADIILYLQTHPTQSEQPYEFW